LAGLKKSEGDNNEMIQASLRDARDGAAPFRGLKPTAIGSRRSATKRDACCGAGYQPAPHADARTHLLAEAAEQVGNLLRPLKTPALYEQCAQPLKETAANAAHLAALNDAKKRDAAIAALTKGCEARAIAPLLELLKADDGTARIAAAQALGQLGSADAVEPMIEALANDKDARVRAALGLALGSFAVHAARNAALNVLVNPGGVTINDEADLRARCFGVLVVNQMIDVRFSRKAIGFLFGFLDHRDPKLRAVAEEAAVELQHTRNGLRELFGIIKVSNYPDHRRKTVYWLGRWGDPEARDLLTETAANDRDVSVKAAAAEALSKLKVKSEK
jgi:HEAT repeat protein